MDLYIKREQVMQALTYVGTAPPTDIIPLTLATARNSIMRLPTKEFEDLKIIVSQRTEIEHLTAENKRLQNLLNDLMKDEVTT